MQQLPEDTFSHVASYLNPRERAESRAVSTQWNHRMHESWIPEPHEVVRFNGEWSYLPDSELARLPFTHVSLVGTNDDNRFFQRMHNLHYLKELILEDVSTGECETILEHYQRETRGSPQLKTLSITVTLGNNMTRIFQDLIPPNVTKLMLLDRATLFSSLLPLERLVHLKEVVLQSDRTGLPQGWGTHVEKITFRGTPSHGTMLQLPNFPALRTLVLETKISHQQQLFAIRQIQHLELHWKPRHLPDTLTSLTLYGGVGEKIRMATVLDQCRQLVRLELFGFKVRLDADAPRSPLLQHLGLSMVSRRVQSLPLFEDLLPNITSLHIYLYDPDHIPVILTTTQRLSITVATPIACQQLAKKGFISTIRRHPRLQHVHVQLDYPEPRHFVYDTPEKIHRMPLIVPTITIKPRRAPAIAIDMEAVE